MGNENNYEREPSNNSMFKKCTQKPQPSINKTNNNRKNKRIKISRHHLEKKRIRILLQS